MAGASISIADAKTKVEAALANGGKLNAENTLGLIGSGLSMKFINGAYVVRVAGVGGTSTIGWEKAFESWLRAAEKRLAKEALNADI